MPIVLSPARAVRLRRLAELTERQAERSRSPQAALKLARHMRLRASELEAGAALSDELEAARLMAEMGGVDEIELEADADARALAGRLERHRRLIELGQKPAP